jgi:hypothetical protein
MKALALVRMTGWCMAAWWMAAAAPCTAENSCLEVAAREVVEIARQQEELTLADFLTADSCPQLLEQAAQVKLGGVPRPGGERVFDGLRIRGLILDLPAGRQGFANAFESARLQIPERIVVRRPGETRSCAEIARFLAGTVIANRGGESPPAVEHLHCAALPRLAKETRLELAQTAWNAALERSEFWLRCAPAWDCVPFLVWSEEPGPGRGATTSASGTRRDSPRRNVQPVVVFAAAHRDSPAAPALVRPGQSASLTWEQAGIRLVVRVTCLEGGGAGQFVRVRLKPAGKIVRAEVVGAGELRVAL